MNRNKNCPTETGLAHLWIAILTERHRVAFERDQVEKAAELWQQIEDAYMDIRVEEQERWEFDPSCMPVESYKGPLCADHPDGSVIKSVQQRLDHLVGDAAADELEWGHHDPERDAEIARLRAFTGGRCHTSSDVYLGRGCRADHTDLMQQYEAFGILPF